MVFKETPRSPGDEDKKISRLLSEGLDQNDPAPTPKWVDFVEYCKKLEHGEIGKLQIQNGVPISAEYVTTKIKFR